MLRLRALCLTLLALSVAPRIAVAEPCPRGVCRAHGSERRWCKSTVTVSPIGLSTTLRLNLQTAITQINVAGAQVQLMYDVSPPADIEVTMGTVSNPANKAETNPEPDDGNVITYASIVLKSSRTWPNNNENIDTLIHELLHALGLVDEYCAECENQTVMYGNNQSTYFTDLDGRATLALYCRYGTMEYGCDQTLALALLDWEQRETNNATVMRGSCGQCNRPCQSAATPPGVASAAAVVRTYDLAVSEDWGPFETLATIDDSDWIADEYSLALTRGYSRARLRMRMFEDGVLSDEVTTYEPRDLAYAPLSVATSTPRATWLRVLSNPVKSHATIEFEVEQGGEVALDLIDVAGRVRGLVAASKFEAGKHQVVWDRLSSSVSRGVYFLRMRAAPNVRRVVAVILE